MKIISLMNQKGGVGKTTSTINIGACLSKQGYKVLLIDTDPQGNLTQSTGARVEPGASTTLYEVLTQDQDINQAIIELDNYDLVPCDILLGRADLELVNIPGNEFLLKEAVGTLNKDYDFILIDNPPALNRITLMNMTASDYILIPIQSQYLAMGGFNQLIETIATVKKRLNHNIQLLGAFLTMYDARKNLDTTILSNLKNIFPSGIFETKINVNVSLAEAPAYKTDVLEYKPKSSGAIQYQELTNEILNKLKTL